MTEKYSFISIACLMSGIFISLIVLYMHRQVEEDNMYIEHYNLIAALESYIGTEYELGEIDCSGLIHQSLNKASSRSGTIPDFSSYEVRYKPWSQNVEHYKSTHHRFVLMLMEPIVIFDSGTSNWLSSGSLHALVKHGAAVAISYIFTNSLKATPKAKFAIEASLYIAKLLRDLTERRRPYAQVDKAWLRLKLIEYYTVALASLFETGGLTEAKYTALMNRLARGLTFRSILRTHLPRPHLILIDRDFDRCIESTRANLGISSYTSGVQGWTSVESRMQNLLQLEYPIRDYKDDLFTSEERSQLGTAINRLKLRYHFSYWAVNIRSSSIS